MSCAADFRKYQSPEVTTSLKLGLRMTKKSACVLMRFIHLGELPRLHLSAYLRQWNQTDSRSNHRKFSTCWLRHLELFPLFNSRLVANSKHQNRMQRRFSIFPREGFTHVNPNTRIMPLGKFTDKFSHSHRAPEFSQVLHVTANLVVPTQHKMNYHTATVGLRCMWYIKAFAQTDFYASTSNTL